MFRPARAAAFTPTLAHPRATIWSARRPPHKPLTIGHCQTARWVLQAEIFSRGRTFCRRQIAPISPIFTGLMRRPIAPFFRHFPDVHSCGAPRTGRRHYAPKHGNFGRTGPPWNFDHRTAPRRPSDLAGWRSAGPTGTVARPLWRTREPEHTDAPPPDRLGPDRRPAAGPAGDGRRRLRVGQGDDRQSHRRQQPAAAGHRHRPGRRRLPPADRRPHRRLGQVVRRPGHRPPRPTRRATTAGCSPRT